MIQNSLDDLKNGDISRAIERLERLLHQDLENTDAEYALTGANFWDTKIKRVSSDATPLELAEFLLSQWLPFLQYMKKHGPVREQIMYALKSAVFVTALRLYESLLNDTEEPKDTELCRKIGRCYKTIGAYDRAYPYLTRALELDKDSAAVLADIADCYALCGEIRHAKIFFREAFFKNPEAVELEFLESDIICMLVDEVRDQGYAPKAVPYWIAVFGVLRGVFDVKRELRAVEFGQLKQKIYLLETELGGNSTEKKKILVPHLINCYFWLIDHYINVHADKGTIDKVLLKIRLQDENIYTAYIS